MELFFGELEVPKVITYTCALTARSTKKEYNANGDLLIDLVNRKYTLSVYLGRLDEDEMAAVLAATSDVFFGVTFFDPARAVMTTRAFYIAEQSAELDTVTADGRRYKATKLVLEER